METTRLTRDRLQKHEDVSTNYTVWVGLAVGGTLIAFFLIMRLMGLHEAFYLRALNIFFIFAGILYSLRRYSAQVHDEIDYFKGFEIGFKVSIFAIIPFTLFMFSYLVLDQDFMNYLREYAPFGHYLGPARATGIIFIECVIAGFLNTYMCMQFFKKNKPDI
jgi:hypothetical protein